MALTVYARASWSFPNIPNFRGRFLASDPTIVVDDDIFRMFYTEGFDDGTAIRPVISEAVSADQTTAVIASAGEVAARTVAPAASSAATAASGAAWSSSTMRILRSWSSP